MGVFVPAGILVQVHYSRAIITMRWLEDWNVNCGAGWTWGGSMDDMKWRWAGWASLSLRSSEQVTASGERGVAIGGEGGVASDTDSWMRAVNWILSGTGFVRCRSRVRVYYWRMRWCYMHYTTSLTNAVQNATRIKAEPMREW